MGMCWVTSANFNLFLKRCLVVFAAAFCLMLVTAFQSSKLFAHFQELIPSKDIVSPDGSALLGLSLQFTHPMEQGPVMDMARPLEFGVLIGSSKIDLSGNLHKVESDNQQTNTKVSRWRADYKLSEPGDHIFYLRPAPYWEAAEGKFIVHYSKVVVDGFHGGEGWDRLVGLPVEIEPIVRPYGLWTNNLFRGRVLRHGKPVPFATIEVEFKNDGGAVKPPSAPYITQVIKADANGVFAYGMPRAGWWGFAALTEGDEKMKNPSGELSPVEEGGLIWVRTRDMK